MAELYPPTDPHDHGMLEVGDGNLVYWETRGDPDGKAALSDLRLSVHRRPIGH